MPPGLELAGLCVAPQVVTNNFGKQIGILPYHIFANRIVATHKVPAFKVPNPAQITVSRHSPALCDCSLRKTPKNRRPKLKPLTQNLHAQADAVSRIPARAPKTYGVP